MNIWEKEKKEKITQINGHGNEGDPENPGDQDPVISAEGKIIIGEAEWDANTHTASVTINKVDGVDENLQVQYQIGGTSEEKWVIGETATGIQHGQTVYARFWNGTKGGAYIEKKIIDGISPGVLVSITGTGTNTITATVEAGDNQSGLPSSPTYTFSIKEKGGLDSTYKTEQSNSSTICQFTNLKQNTEYTIKVTVQDKAGNTGEATVDGRTETVVVSTGNITFTLNPDIWTNGDVTVTASTAVTGYKLQVSTSTTFPTTATEVKSVTVSTNQKVYARLIDSTNQANGYVETEVTKIDKTKPIVTVATPTTNSVSITATDEASGIIGYKVTESDTEPTEFTSCANTKSLSTTVSNLTQNKTYYSWVKDEAGNVSLAKEFKTTQVIGSTGNINVSAPTWDANTHTTSVTLSKGTGIDASLKIQYQINGYEEGKWTEGTTVTGIKHNDTVYARLVDTTGQANGHASWKITDSIDPTAEISLDKTEITTEETATATVELIDNQSGIDLVNCKWKLSKESVLGTDDVSKYTNSFDISKGENQEILISSTEAGTYYLHVLVQDNAGRKIEKVFENIKIEEAGPFIGVDKNETDPEGALPSGDIEIIEPDISKGVVIKDKNDNEWVWIVVPKSVTNSATNDVEIEANLLEYSKSYETYHQSDEWYNGCGLTEEEYNENRIKMLRSIKQNGGFWISRYEIGDSTSTADWKVRYRLRGTTSGNYGMTGEPVSRKDQIPYSWVTITESQTLAKRISPDNNKTSSLLFGVQVNLIWKYLEGKDGLTSEDMLQNGIKNWANFSDVSISINRGRYSINSNSSSDNWIVFSTNKSPYVTSGKTNSSTSYNVLLTTGASESTKKMNIYDIMGNLQEWILAKYTGSSAASSPALAVGFSYKSNSTCSVKIASDSNCTYADEKTGFRVTFY